MTTRLNSGTARGRSARRRNRGRAVVAAGLALLVAGLGVAAALEPADASALQVTATSDTAVSRGACTNQPLAVSSTTYSGTSTTQIAVTTLDGGPLDAACVGRPLSVIVQAGDDTASRLVSVTMPSATDRPVFNVDFVTAQATRALVTIDGFALPTTWAGPTQPPALVTGCWVTDGSATTCQVTNQQVNNNFGPVGARVGYLQVSFAFTPNQMPQTFEVGIDMRALLGWTPATVSVAGSGIGESVLGCGQDVVVVQVTSNGHWLSNLNLTANEQGGSPGNCA